jgi:hypothetical protein
MTSMWNRGRVLGPVAGTLSVIAVAAAVGTAHAATAATAAVATVKLSSNPLGMNIPPWNALYANTGSGNTIQALLKNAHVSQIRYGGGQYSDDYDWQNNTDITHCPSTAVSEYAAKCATHDALDFTLLSRKARTIGAQSFVTVNYGSGTPAEAGAWAKQAKKSGQQVGLWEIGNESYGCWEDNDWLADAPEFYKGYKPTVDSTCPMNKDGLNAGMAIMASSYAANAGTMMARIRAANPKAVLGVPWAFDSTVGGAAVGANTVWNDTVLAKDKKYIGFVDPHWYPYSFGGATGVGGNPTAEQVIQSVTQIPAEYAKIRAQLNKYDLPGAKIVVGETGVSYLATNTACTPVGALFAAGDALEWLSAGAYSVDWWAMNGFGNTGTTCSHPDEGMFTSNARPKAESPYIGYLLAGNLARSGAKLTALTVSPSGVLAFQSVLPNGKVDVLLINTNTSAQERATFRSSLAGKLTTVSYKAAGQNSFGTRTTSGKTTAAAVARGIVLPAESMTLLREN